MPNRFRGALVSVARDGEVRAALASAFGADVALRRPVRIRLAHRGFGDPVPTPCPDPFYQV